MARTTDPDLHARRTREILLAASAVFRAKSFHLARTDEICAVAKLSAGTVFRHFKTKKSMIDAIAQIEIQSFLDDVKSLATREGLTWLSRLQANDVAQLLRSSEFALGTDSWSELVRDERTRPRVVKADREAKSRLEKVILQGKTDGWIRADVDAKGFSVVLLAMLSGLLFDVELGLKLPNQAVARAIAGLMQNVIAPET